MPKGILIVETRPSHPDRVDEYDAWYDEVHLPDILAVPGIVAARRYRACDRTTGAPDPDAPAYVAIYEIEADDLTAPGAEMRARSAAGRHRISDALQVDPPPRVTLYELLE